MIHLGTSGFSYDDWKGHFYPDRIKSTDMLAFYSKHFGTVEINSTYYAIPSASTFASMAGKTPPDFKFAVKAHQDMTHVESAKPETFTAFLGAVQPLIDASKLGCILAQFPWSFKNTPDNVIRLREFKDRVGDLPTVIEFRNSDWADEDTFVVLRELDLGFCSVDEPSLEGLMPRIAVATANIGYVRFHGRNTAKWWKHSSSYERYDYLYSEEELAEWVPKVEALAAETEVVFIYFNNHYEAKAAINARLFASMLNLRLPMDDIPPPSEQLGFGEGF